ncbi:MAG: carboxypeptidase regulatory-like domain-containing protein [Myxococcaceae bacterium]|nr:carboxypeptidase regulatory-like domain-containing protein [Myxococcaceae bacterium]MCA3014958.1 carboxypeptidase regulatory-like domain-containing protein [Myxococcaceae bacterium]
MRCLTILLSAVLAGACTQTTPPARAFKVGSRADLIGGKRALADVGDYKITNGLIQAVVQDVGTSRGFGAFGGSLIDVDLVRGTEATATKGPVGNDYFTEMFPAFFLTAIEPSKVEAVTAPDGTAKIVVSGRSGSFISVVNAITDVVYPKEPLDYSVEYQLEPGRQYLKIVTTVTNPGTADVQFPLSIPFGFVTLLGEGQRLFVPGEAGFDMRFHLEDTVYKRNADLQALPGEVTSMWTTEGDGVSYALVAARSAGGGYMGGKSQFYPTAKPDSLLIPIASSSFLGSFWARSPEVLRPKQSFSYVGYLAVGSGDVASAQRVVYELRDVRQNPNGSETVLRDKTPYGTVSGLVREGATLRPMGGVSVVLQNAAGEYLSQATTLPSGLYSAPVPPGRYRAYAVDASRDVAVSDFVEVAEGGQARVDLSLSEPGDLRVVVRDASGQAIPAKLSIEGVYENDVPGRLPRAFLYNLKAGERYRRSDFVPDDPADPGTRRYLEKVLFAHDGSAGARLRPGRYTVWASRGIEYTLEQREVEIVAGKTTTIGLSLTHVLPTKGWISADFHVHSVKSVDSDMELDERVASFAVEGVDLMTSTDHNMVADYQPTIDALGLEPWLRSVVGLELTSLEMGHFNAFPIATQPGPIQHGSFRWFYRPPGELFAQLRGLGKDPQRTIVQVNHPRDTVLGYFNAFDVGTYTGRPLPAPSSLVRLDRTPRPDGSPSPYDPVNFSLAFDVMEVFNGKRLDNMFAARVPTRRPEGPEPTLPACPADGAITVACLPRPGEVIEKPIKYTENGVEKIVLQPAFPGAQDEWFTLLGQGRRVVATGNSDSHSAGAEAGLPRTYLEVGASADGPMRALDVDRAMDALREGRAFVTNGPLVTVDVDGVGPGGTAVNANGVFRLRVKVEAAPWVDVTRVVVRRGGPTQGKRPEVLKAYEVQPSSALLRFEQTELLTGVPDDSFFVVEVFGERSMWPVFSPYEVPSLQISDAVGVIGGAFGFGSTYGKYEPQLAQAVKPYAFTNPIWAARARKQALTAPKKVLPVSNAEPFAPRQLPDLRRLFLQFHADLE